MSAIEEFVMQYERCEDDSDMHFSLYSIPTYYHEEEHYE